MDWQIWLEDGEQRLPKKLVITSKWITGAPQFTMTVKSWNLAPQFTEDMFTFTPPAEARQIDFIRTVSKAPLK